MFIVSPAQANPSEPKGRFLGAMETEYPSWFKDSFLDLQEDLGEATETGKRLVIFFHQDGCPYCNALVERNFAQRDIVEKTRKHFDVVALNMWGDRLITGFDGKQYTEKALAEILKVQFTPTMLFYDEQGEVVLRVNGYRSPQRFSIDLDYVLNNAAQHTGEKISYREYVRTHLPSTRSNKKLNPEAFFNPPPFDYRTKPGARPFAVFFEQKDCPGCDQLHNQVLPDTGLRAIITRFDNTQLDMWSKTPLVTPDGRKIHARDWAQELNIQYAPSIVIFNPQGEEIIRLEAFFKVFHIQAAYNYVLSEGYKEQSSFQRYLSDYVDQLREQGQDVNIWRLVKE
jgi:thioredoxin-related protein